MLVKSRSEPQSVKVGGGSNMAKAGGKIVTQGLEENQKRDYEKERQDMLFNIARQKRMSGHDDGKKQLAEVNSADRVHGQRGEDQRRVGNRDYEREREDMRKMIIERRKAVLASKVTANPLSSTDDTGVSLSSASTTVVNRIPDRSHSAESTAQRNRPESAVSSNARTAEFSKTLPENHRLDSPSSTHHGDDAETPRLPVPDINKAHISSSQPPTSWSSAAEYFGRFASLLFRRDQKIKPMSPKLKLSGTTLDPMILLEQGAEDVKEDLETPAFKEPGKITEEDDDTFGSEDETWRKEIDCNGEDVDSEGQSERLMPEREIYNETQTDSAYPSAQLDYTLMLEDMQAILRLPAHFTADSDDAYIPEDEFDDMSIELTGKEEAVGESGLSPIEEIEEIVDFHGSSVPSADVSGAHIDTTFQDDEGARLNLTAFIEEANTSNDKAATQSAQILRLQLYLTKQLGEKRFLAAYTFLKEGNALNIEEEVLLGELERILTIHGLLYLDEMFTLLALEST